jgi:hypothetical protein
VDISALLLDAFDRVRQEVQGVLDGIEEAHLTYRPDPEANTIAWLVWHLTRIQDDHVAHVAGTDQRWTADGWYERFGLPFEPSASGWSQSADEVAAVRCSAELLAGYYDAVHQASVGYLKTLGESDLDRVVDTRWDPPVTLGVRLVSVIADDLQHVGQAAYLRGLAERAG